MLLSLLVWASMTFDVMQGGVLKEVANQNVEMLLRPLSKVDFFGPLVRLLDAFFAMNTVPPKNPNCKPRIFAIGENELLVSNYPYGTCTYCCSLKNINRQVRLFLITQSGNTVRLKMGRKPGAVRTAGLNSTIPTVIYIHGFTEHGFGPCSRIIKDAYLSREEPFNVILVDWGELSSFPWYRQAANNTIHVAAIVAKFIKFYHETGEMPIAKIHLVGFSLGAHISGFIGKHLKKSGTIPRITALDPAFPLFPIEDKTARLSKGDAYYVDVIHTDAGKFGFPVSIGDADFYPNGGTYFQPGCEFSKLADRNIVDQLGSCDHQRALRFYAESVRNPTAFPATKCGILRNAELHTCRFIAKGYMGFAADNRTTLGDFYLTTNDRKPFTRSAKDQEETMKAMNLVINLKSNL